MDDGGNQWVNDVRDQGVDNGRKRGADDHGDGQVHDIAAKNKIAKAFQHVGLLKDEGAGNRVQEAPNREQPGASVRSILGKEAEKIAVTGN
jgi:hypothetical protein